MSLSPQHDRGIRQEIGFHSPFGQTPGIEPGPSGGIPIQCQFCPCQRFRRSRLRSKDLRELFLMRYPVRCLRCGQRQTVSYTVAAVSVPSHVRHRRAKGKSSQIVIPPQTEPRPIPPPREDGEGSSLSQAGESS